MSAVEDKEHIKISGWVEEDLSKIDINEQVFGEFSEYFSSLVDAANISDVETTFEGFGHADVTFEVETRQVETYREIVLRLTIRNWRSHAGGSSSYTRLDGNDLEYQCTPDSEKPADDMVLSGAFFHLLNNRFKEIGNEISQTIWTPELVEYNDEYAVYETTIQSSKYDDN